MEIAYKSDRGKIRIDNQDYVGSFINDKHNILNIVNDGISKKNRGDIAANLAGIDIGTEWENSSINDINVGKEWLLNILKKENDKLYNLSLNNIDLKEMSTTIVISMHINNKMLIFNLGDSKGYLYHQNKLNKITTDHVLANELVKRGLLTVDESKSDKSQHILTKSLGIIKNVELNFNIINVNQNDILLLCTDGLTKSLNENDIIKSINRLDINKSVDNLIENALIKDATDNVTVLLCKVGKDNELK